MQALAIVHHVRHHEAKALPINIVLLLAALFVAVFRSPRSDRTQLR